MDYSNNLRSKVSEKIKKNLGVAQSGRAGVLGTSGRRFESCHLDQLTIFVTFSNDFCHFS